MTTTANLLTDVSTVDDRGCQRYYVYSRIADVLGFGELAVPVSSALDCPEYLEHRVWLEHRPGILASYGPFSAASDLAHSPYTGSEQPPEVPPVSSTSDAIDKELLREGALVSLFESYVRDASDERFEDGMGSTFAARVHDSVLRNGSVAVAAWERVLLQTGNVYETGEELLRQLGLIDHTPSHYLRLSVLTDSVTSFDKRIRDAASLGIAFLDDPSALPALRVAYSTENETWLKENLKLVIDQLEALECRDT